LIRPPKSLLLPNVSYINPIIVACIALYALALALGIAWTPSITNLLTPSDIALYKLGMTGRLPVANGRWWTPITAIYLHGGILHITFNMLALHQAGPLVERLFGPYRFFLIYTISGLFGALVSTLMGTYLTVGASGAIFGLMGALIYYGHRIGELPRFLPILRWAAINFLLGMVTPQVDNWGHAGGFVGGVLIAMAFMAPRSSGLAYRLYGRLATIAFVATLLAFGLSLVIPIDLMP
jgi:rhomboid protease GluP